MNLITHEIPPVVCLNCGAELLSASSMRQSVDGPQAGNLAVCVECGMVTMFGDDLKLRALTLEEMAEVVESPRTMEMLIQVTAKIRFFRAAMNN